MPNPIVQSKAQHEKAQPKKAQQLEAQHIARTTSQPKAWPIAEHKDKTQRKAQPKTLTKEEIKLLSTKPRILSDHDRRKRKSIKDAGRQGQVTHWQRDGKALNKTTDTLTIIKKTS